MDKQSMLVSALVNGAEGMQQEEAFKLLEAVVRGNMNLLEGKSLLGWPFDEKATVKFIRSLKLGWEDRATLFSIFGVRTDILVHFYRVDKSIQVREAILPHLDIDAMTTEQYFALQELIESRYERGKLQEKALAAHGPAFVIPSGEVTHETIENLPTIELVQWYSSQGALRELIDLLPATQLTRFLGEYVARLLTWEEAEYVLQRIKGDALSIPGDSSLSREIAGILANLRCVNSFQDVLHFVNLALQNEKVYLPELAEGYFSHYNIQCARFLPSTVEEWMSFYPGGEVHKREFPPVVFTPEMIHHFTKDQSNYQAARVLANIAHVSVLTKDTLRLMNKLNPVALSSPGFRGISATFDFDAVEYFKELTAANDEDMLQTLKLLGGENSTLNQQQVVQLLQFESEHSVAAKVLSDLALKLDIDIVTLLVAAGKNPSAIGRAPLDAKLNNSSVNPDELEKALSTLSEEERGNLAFAVAINSTDGRVLEGDCLTEWAYSYLMGKEKLNFAETTFLKRFCEHRKSEHTRDATIKKLIEQAQKYGVPSDLTNIVTTRDGYRWEDFPAETANLLFQCNSNVVAHAVLQRFGIRGFTAYRGLLTSGGLAEMQASDVLTLIEASFS